MGHTDSPDDPMGEGYDPLNKHKIDKHGEMKMEKDPVQYVGDQVTKDNSP